MGNMTASLQWQILVHGMKSIDLSLNYSPICAAGTTRNFFPSIHFSMKGSTDIVYAVLQEFG
jgi:hypothetical protein